MDTVATVADTRAGLSKLLRTFRAEPFAEPVTIGSHRKPEAVLMPVDRYRALTSATDARPTAILDDLRTRANLIRRLATFSKIDGVAVFGSVARKAENAASDIDLLVTPADDASLFDLAQFEIDMEQLTGRKVDVVSRGSLDPERDAAVLAEAVAL